MSLPDEYKHFVSAWESAPDDKQTIDNLVARLLIEEERVKGKLEDSQQASSSAFVVRQKRQIIKCNKYGKIGHFQSGCRNNKTGSDDNANNNCFYCGKFGHYKAQCRFRKQKFNKTENKTKSNAFVVSTSGHELHTSKWLVDSGSSENMCRNRALFTSFTSAKEQSVIVGNGAAISVLGCGQVAVQVSNGIEWIDTVIDNVLYVPDLNNNLFSVIRATDKDYTMVTDDRICKFYKQNNICAMAERIGDSYYLNMRYKQ